MKLKSLRPKMKFSIIIILVVCFSLGNVVMAQGIGKYINAIFGSVNIKLNNVPSSIENLKYNNKVYVPLEDICSLLNKDIKWDSKSNTYNISNTTSNGSNYEAIIKAPFDYSMVTGNIKISGKVNTKSNTPIEGATVYLIGLNKINKISLLDITDNNGNFSIPDVSPGKYKIVFGKEDFKPVTITATIDNSNKTFIQALDNSTSPKWLEKETARMIYHYKEGQEISDIEISAQEERLESIEGFLDEKVSKKIHYYQTTSQRESSLLAFNNEDFLADAFYMPNYNAIYSIGGAFNWHETTHAVTNMLNPQSNASLDEGLAVFFAWGEIGSPLQWHTPINAAAKQLIDDNQLLSIPSMLKRFNNEYTQCGSFVTFLLKNYKVEQFKELFNLMPKNPTNENIETIINDVYGKSSLKLYNEWRVYLGGKPVTETELVKKVSVPIIETVNIEGFTTQDVKNKNYQIRTLYYGDKDLKNEQASGLIDLYELPQESSTALFREGHFYILAWLDLDKDFELDNHETKTVVEATFKEGQTTRVDYKLKID
ncbi:MAG: carboxypeptidase-like regulatory domain-containing protein [Ruminiclostridium sp.]